MKKLLILFILFSYSCKTHIVTQEETYNTNNEEENAKILTKYGTIFYFIRHAETKKGTNPHLSEKGIKRAYLYAQYFADKKIDTVFTTNLNRTVETATIIAKTKNAKVMYYDPFNMDYAKFIKDHKDSKSLIVGHSNTTPKFANGIIGKQKYAQMVENNYSDIYLVVINGNNKIADKVSSLENEIQQIEDDKLSPKELKKVLRTRRKK